MAIQQRSRSARASNVNLRVCNQHALGRFPFAATTDAEVVVIIVVVAVILVIVVARGTGCVAQHKSSVSMLTMDPSK